MKKYLAGMLALATLSSAAYAYDVERCHRECKKLVKEPAKCTCICENECTGLPMIKRDDAEPAKREELEVGKPGTPAKPEREKPARDA